MGGRRRSCQPGDPTYQILEFLERQILEFLERQILEFLEWQILEFEQQILEFSSKSA